MPRRDAATVPAALPECYLSRAEGRFTVIAHGSPICASTPDRERALAAAARLHLVPTTLWDGDAGVFRALEEV